MLTMYCIKFTNNCGARVLTDVELTGSSQITAKRIVEIVSKELQLFNLIIQLCNAIFKFGSMLSILYSKPFAISNFYSPFFSGLVIFISYLNSIIHLTVSCFNVL